MCPVLVTQNTTACCLLHNTFLLLSAAACFLTFYDEVLPPQLRRLIPSVAKGCLQPYSIFQVGQHRSST
jgi:hypothetical protein